MCSQAPFSPIQCSPPHYISLRHKIMKYFEVSSEIICCWLPGSWACFVLSTFCSLKVISSSFPPIRWDTQSWSELLLCYADILFTGAANPVLVRGSSDNFSSFITGNLDTQMLTIMLTACKTPRPSQNPIEPPKSDNNCAAVGFNRSVVVTCGYFQIFFLSAQLYIFRNRP